MPRPKPDINIKERFYYVRDKQNRPVVTVCLGTDENGVHSRGVAYCSDKDIPKKSTGRAIARGRMLKAFHNQETFDPICFSRMETKIMTDISLVCFDKKSHYDCALTMRERFSKSPGQKPFSVYDDPCCGVST